jgi:hypothetical protein
MAGVIVSANVAGGTAGGNIIPEPIWPSFATYPDTAEKDDQSLRSIFLDNLNKLLGRVVDRTAPPEKKTPDTSGAITSSALPLILLVVAVIVVVKLLR